MADYCRQCSEELFGEDFGNLVLDDCDSATVLCEGCGWTVVERDGTCVGKCLASHGDRDIDVDVVQDEGADVVDPDGEKDAPEKRAEWE